MQRALLPLLAASAACGPVVVVEPDPGPPPLLEVEWNDTPDQTSVFDPLLPGMELELHGHVDDWSGPDLADHVGLFIESPQWVTLEARGADGPLDVDLAVWDDLIGAYVAAAQTVGNVEVLELMVLQAQPLQVRVDSPFEGGAWCLTVRSAALSPGLGQEDREPSSNGSRIRAREGFESP